MANYLPSDTIFDNICRKIFHTFNTLIEQLVTRRDELMAEVNAMKSEFKYALIVEDENMRELEKLQSQIEHMSIKQKLPSNMVQASLAPIRKQIENVTQPPNLSFECPFGEMSDKLRKFGSVVVNKMPLAIDYQSKKKAQIILKCTSPTYLHVDGAVLFAIGSLDYSSTTLNKYDMINWTLENSITSKRYSEFIAIVSTSEHLYLAIRVTRFIHRSEEENDWDPFITFDPPIEEKNYYIHKLDKATFQEIKNVNVSESKTKYGFGCNSFTFSYLAISPDNEIFLFGDSGSELEIFDNNLFYRREINVELSIDYIRFKEDHIYGLAQGNIYHLSKTGKNLGILNDGKSIEKFSSKSFCFDPRGNIVLLDSFFERIIVFSPEGEIIYQIGGNSQCNEDIDGCSDVIIFQDKIIVACKNLNCIKIF